jgi:cation diffusion facilitator CzcD-associated flavoprotein CzcO
VTELPSHVHVAIIGAGFGGLGMAIRLRQEGITDFVVLERGDDVGGTWRDNTYPGCQCDIPSHLYSFSFAPNPDWTRFFPLQQEIWDYLRRCTRDFGIESQLHLRTELEEAAWDDAAQRWTLRTSRGTVTADVVVAAVGALSEPSVPPLAGLDSFGGTVFHSAAWDHDHDLRGERVAVVGTGASAIQFVPRIQPLVDRLALFQRTPAWILPHPDRAVSARERRLFRRHPIAQRAIRGALYAVLEARALGFTVEPRILRLAERQAERHLHGQVADPELRQALRPSYRLGCKRVLISNDFYPAVAQPNVALVQDAIARVTPSGIVTADGTEHELDAIVFATGFRVSEMPAALRVRGREGRTLAETWQGSPQAYVGTSIAGFPNLFMLMGPNTGLGHNSVVYMIESQLAYVLDALAAMRERAAASVEVRPEVQTGYNTEVQQRLEGTVWATGCKSWYQDSHGRNTALWPGFTFGFRRRTRRFAPADYVLERRAPAAAEPEREVASTV